MVRNKKDDAYKLINLILRPKTKDTRMIFGMDLEFKRLLPIIIALCVIILILLAIIIF